MFEQIPEDRRLQPSERGQPGPNMTAGQFLWYVTKVIVVVSVLLVGLGYALSAQGLTDDHTCKTFVSVVEKIKATEKDMQANGITLGVATVDPSMVQPIMKVVAEQGVEVPNTEAVDQMVTVQFPDGNVIMALGAGGCSYGMLSVPGEEFKSMMQKLSGEAL